VGDLYEIAIKSPLRRLLIYESANVVSPGARVRVPVKNSKRLGIVWAKTAEVPPGLKSISDHLDVEPIFDQKTLEFYDVASRYYGLALGELLNFSLPKKIREGEALKEFEPKVFSPLLPALSPAQQEVVEEVQAKSGFVCHLLVGETGSGKTEIYLKLIEKILNEGGQVLVLVPEISLTPQLEDRLKNRLGKEVSLFHSSLKESKRMEAFCRARAGQSDVFLGARSALFLPFKGLRLIVVDEEHDASYKQNERGTYQARDLAILKAKLLQIPILLGSATPSLESYQRAKSTGSPLFRIPRFFEAPPVQVEVVDLKKTWKTEEKSFITSAMHRAVDETLMKKEQVLLFLNRRGSATQRVCVSCGHTEGCPNCSTGLTLHFDLKKAICHLCAYEAKIENLCAKCGGKDFFVGGIGTKEVEIQIQERFPEARVARLDRDQAKKKNVVADVLHAFSKGELDILVGTQMISKGIDIAKLSLVGVVLADQGWNLPDFRAMERSFQLMHQIKGRGGRRGQASRFLVQTFNPEHPLFAYLNKSESDAWEVFAEKELELRKLAVLPPYSRYLLWTLSHRNEKEAIDSAYAFRRRLEKLATSLKIELMGPVPSPLAKWKNEYRMQILAKSEDVTKLTTFQTAVLDDLDKRPMEARIRHDRDPVQFM